MKRQKSDDIPAKGRRGGGDIVAVTRVVVRAAAIAIAAILRNQANQQVVMLQAVPVKMLMVQSSYQNIYTDKYDAICI